MSLPDQEELIANIRKELGTNPDILRERLNQIAGERKVLLQSIEDVQEKLTDGWHKSQALKTLIEEVRLGEMQENGVDWDILLNNQESLAVHKAFKTEISRLGLVPDGGYWVDTEQRVIKIALIQGDQDSLDKHISAINLLLPYLKPSDGWIKFKISEESLSEGGSWCLEVDPITQHSNISRTTWGRKTIQASFDNIPEALSYIQTNLYYGRVESQTFKI